MTDSADDVKDLLGRAFGDEPPLRLDRDQVIEHGRKRLRKKRFFEAGGVVAAVVVAAVGAATLTNLNGAPGPEKLPPAASSTYPEPPATTSTYQAPAGPDLPLTTTRTAPPTRPVMPPGALLLDPAALTARLYATGVLSPAEAHPMPGQPRAVTFTKIGEQVVYRADVTRADTQGFVEVVISAAPGVEGGCGTTSPTSATGCGINHDTDVVVNHFVDGNGQRRTVASTTLPNGLRVTATATNLTIGATYSGGKGDDSPPVLTDDELRALITKAGFGA
jgi:hypothetical protein